ncbi:3-keto-5-aminohexanoate cleavage protein [Saccharopolyspora taberi]|uniref:3-keto-5-aminohexanoate cleavage protein n=1 Tax=Saccharopolyspora taberi TaxID=60895 RepID=A0ABN3VLE9_9PSEU
MTALPHGTVLAVAPTGTRSDDEVPGLPVAPDEIARAVADCERVGASVVDLEPRRGTVLADVVAAVRARSAVLIRITAHARAETLPELLDCGADVIACPLDAPEEFADDLRDRAREQGVAVHYEARTLDELRKLPADATHVVLVFDERGMPGDVQTFSAALDLLPTSASFTASGVGPANLPVMLTALAAGGHLRVGLADSPLYSDDVPARDNAQLVARAAGLAKIAQRPPLARAAEVLT